MCSASWTGPPDSSTTTSPCGHSRSSTWSSKAKSTSVGTITEAGLESEAAGTAQVLVAVAVKTSNAGAPEQDPRAWRMRIFVEQVGDQAKVSNVEFVP